MFPKINIDTSTTNKAASIGKSFLFNFKEGDFEIKDGRLVETNEIEKLKVWVEKALRTEKFRFNIYEGVDYGITLEDLIGKSLPRSFVESEIKREVIETLTKHEMIYDVSKFSSIQDGSKLILNFTLLLSDNKNTNIEVVL